MKQRFAAFTDRTTDILGSPWATLTAVLIVVVWFISGPFMGWSDAWLLIINTVTTIVTFIMAFLILSSSNRSSKATHLKLDEIIKWMNDKTEPEEALGAEKLTEEEIDQKQEALHKQ